MVGAHDRQAWGATSTLLIALAALRLGLVGSPAIAAAQDEWATVRIDGRAVFHVGPTEGADAACYGWCSAGWSTTSRSRT